MGTDAATEAGWRRAETKARDAWEAARARDAALPEPVYRKEWRDLSPMAQQIMTGKALLEAAP